VIEELKDKFLPKAVIINSQESGYVKTRLDEKSIQFLVKNFFKIDDNLIKLKVIGALFNEGYYLELLELV
jgi:hypothetical protein